MNSAAVKRAPLALEFVVAVPEELGAGHVQPQVHVAARLVAGLLDRLQDDPERRLVGLEVGGEAALIAHRGRQVAVGEDLLEGVEHLGAVAQRLAEARRPDRQDHELLDIEAVVGVGAAVHDVHHRHRHHRLAPAADELRQVAVVEDVPSDALVIEVDSGEGAVGENG